MKDYPIGKYRRLSRLANENGQFSMLAIDQRKSLRGMISAALGTSPESVTPKDLSLVKRIVTKELSPLASALLTDPIYGYESTLDVIPRDTGVMLSIEVTGYNVVNTFERHSRLIENFSVEKASALGADAIKLLIWHHHEASRATLEHQSGIIKRVAESCHKHEVPLILEIVNYPTPDLDVANIRYAREKADRVIEAAKTFSASEFGVDVLKLEFPGNLKYTEEFQSRPFSANAVAYTLDEVKGFNRAVNDASEVPWVILSAGVEPEEFIENIRISNEAGASGFLCGRAVWKNIVNHFPSDIEMTSFIQSNAVGYFNRILASNSDALPWYNHKRFT
jgi:tagatose 1,6-diphosphate aldolase